jgi:tetratricopeptide (TPR) repeat protein
MLKIISLFSLFLFIFTVNAQDVDSLINILNAGKLKSVNQLELYKKVCNAYLDFDQEKLAIYAKKGLELADKENNKSMASKFNEYLGHAVSLDSALFYYDSALELALEAEDNEQIAAIYMSIGGLYRAKREYNEAVDYYLKSLEIIEKEGYERLQIRALINIGGVYRMLDNEEHALHYLTLAEKKAEESNDIYAKMCVSYNLGAIYKKNGEYDKAIKYATETYNISKSLNDKRYEISSLHLLMIINSEDIQNLEKADMYAQECLNIAEEYGDKNLLIGVLNGFSSVYFQQGRYKESSDISIKTWEMDSTDLIYAQETVRNILHCNILLGNKDKAIHFSNKYYELVKQYNEKNFQNAITEMEIKYETEM